MTKAIITTLLLCLSTITYSNSVENSLGIDVNQVMNLLDPESSKINSAKPSAKTVPKPKVTTNSECILPGKVIRVVDGDTVHVLDAKKESHNIRMAGIDAPERGQPYSKAATKYLKKLVEGKQVCVEWYKKDRYRRLVGVVFYNNKDINYEMVKNGYAWHFKKYQREQKPSDRTLYAEAETNSRLRVIGLWQEPDPIKPDDWRAGKRATKKKPIIRTAPTTQAQATSFSCSGKRFCRHMTSCSEAQFYLSQCRISRLDRDKDGIPCESICGGG